MSKRVAKRYREAAGSRTLYHVGKRPPRPVPRRHGGKWDRPWLDEPIKEAVFLTPNPAKVWYHDRQEGNCYVYEVPEWVIDEAGGIHRWKGMVTEVLIPKDLWEHVKFKGKMRPDKWQNMKEKMEREQSSSDFRWNPSTKRDEIGWKGLLDTDHPEQALSIMSESERNELRDKLTDEIQTVENKLDSDHPDYIGSDFRERYEQVVDRKKRKLKRDNEKVTKHEFNKLKQEAEESVRQGIRKTKMKLERKMRKMKQALDVLNEYDRSKAARLSL